MADKVDASLDAHSIKMALRFRKSQARVLRNLADEARSKALPGGAVTLFENAANAAGQGVPLMVLCTDPEEAKAMAEGFAMYGLVPPTVETLSGFITAG